MKTAAPDSSPHPVWDLATRLFHLLLIAAVATSWLTYELGRMELHFYSGYVVTVLLIFRVIWGFVGSRHSRFGDFWPRPSVLVQYLRDQVSLTPGHNPLGSLSVLAMLGLLTVQVATGFVNADEEGNHAPYNAQLPPDWVDKVATIHGGAFNLLAALIALHVVAVLYHRFRREPRIIRAMVTGYKDEPGREKPVSWIRALIVSMISAAAVTALVQWAPPPAAPLYF